MYFTSALFFAPRDDRTITRRRPLQPRLDPADGMLHVDLAMPGEASEIAALLEASVPDCLPQPLHKIRSRLREFEVVRHNHAGVVATAALRMLDGGRAELRGIAVHEDWQGCGLGKIIVRRAVFRALQAGRQPVCVTRRPGFFARLGFHRIPLKSIPDKDHCVDMPNSDRPRVAMAWGGTGAHLRPPEESN